MWGTLVRMRWFSLPIRVAAGLTATALEQTRNLPGHLVGLPVTVTSQALQLSMRLQQQVTEFAIKGDEALAWLHTPQEQPDWATFDEDRDQGTPDRNTPDRNTPDRSAPDRSTPDRGTSAGGTSRDKSAAEDEAGADHGEKTPGTARPATRVLPGYDQMSIHQLRGKLRRLSETDLIELLDYEHAHGQRQEFLRMLSRRLDTVRAQ